MKIFGSSNQSVGSNTTEMNDTTVAETEEAWIERGLVIFFLSVLPVIAVVGVVGNATFMYVFKSVKSMRTLTNYLLLSLSVADFLILATCVPFEYGSIHEVITGEDKKVLCVFWTLFNMVPVFTSMFTIGLISIERYFAICHPLKAYKADRRKRIVGLIIASWVVATVLSAFYLVGCFHLTVGVYVTFAICQMVPFFVSMVVVVILYSLVIIKMRKQSKVTRSVKSISNYYRERHQVVRLLIITTLVYFICVFPDTFLNLQLVLAALGASTFIPTNVHVHLWFICRILLYLNSAVNPIIYNAASSKYRHAFKKTFANCRCCWKTVLTTERSTVIVPSLLKLRSGKSLVVNDQTATVNNNVENVNLAFVDGDDAELAVL
ncbi:kappa-type opioid receptor-like [Saccoglossus kowalevskii]